MDRYQHLLALERSVAPGTWFIRWGPVGRFRGGIYRPGWPDTVATTAFHGWTERQIEAHAQLIAHGRNALPDLLAVVREARVAREWLRSRVLPTGELDRVLGPFDREVTE